MIHVAVEHIINELNAYLSVKISESSKAVQNTLLKQDGTPQNNIEDKIVVSLVNVEEERIAKDPNTFKKRVDGTLEVINPEIKLNLYLLFVAYAPSDYNEALKMISYVIGFFQKKNIFTGSNAPGLDPRIANMNMELFTLNFEQQNHLWGSLGAKYLPSVLYKLRIIPVADEEIKGSGDAITKILINEDEPEE
jgi:hypothetical protein